MGERERVMEMGLQTKTCMWKLAFARLVQTNAAGLF